MILFVCANTSELKWKLLFCDDSRPHKYCRVPSKWLIEREDAYLASLTVWSHSCFQFPWQKEIAKRNITQKMEKSIKFYELHVVRITKQYVHARRAQGKCYIDKCPIKECLHRNKGKRRIWENERAI